MAENMVSMKRLPSDKEEVSCCYEEDTYPWGLRLQLDKEQLDKLDVPPDLSIGQELELVAKVKVVSLSANETEDGEDRSMSLQITDMALSTDMPKKSVAERMFGGKE